MAVRAAFGQAIVERGLRTVGALLRRDRSGRLASALLSAQLEELRLVLTAESGTNEVALG